VLLNGLTRAPSAGSNSFSNTGRSITSSLSLFAVFILSKGLTCALSDSRPLRFHGGSSSLFGAGCDAFCFVKGVEVG